MQEFVAAETNTHQDHVIAHVIGATVVGYFMWDETAYLLLDIGFIWNIYLDGEMGLVPQTQAVNELDAGEDFKRALRSDMDAFAQDVEDSVLKQLSIPLSRSPIQTVDFEQSGNSRRLVITCEESTLVVETSLDTAEVQIHEQ
jgi:hypothetical protein